MKLILAGHWVYDVVIIELIRYYPDSIRLPIGNLYGDVRNTAQLKMIRDLLR